MTRMEPGLDVPDHLFLWPGIHLALGHLAGTPVNDFVPLRFGVRVHGVIQAGEELPGEERPVLFRQGQHFGHLFSSNAHAAIISAFMNVLASLHSRSRMRHARQEKSPPIGGGLILYSRGTGKIIHLF